MLWIILLIFSHFFMALSLPQIHELMTPEELMQIFHTIDSPLYDVFSIHSIEKRSADGRMSLTIRPFDKNMKLWLSPVDDVLIGKQTPYYMLKNIDNELFVEKKRLGSLPIALFEDETHGAALAITTSNRRKRMTGVILSEKLNIYPLPDRLVTEMRRRRRSIDTDEFSNYHIAVKAPGNSTEAFQTDPSTSSRVRRDASSNNEPLPYGIPDVVYPKILVKIDYELFNHFENDDVRAISYILPYWYSVNLKYKSLDRPRYSLNLAGIVLPMDRESSLRYLGDMFHNEKHNEWALDGVMAIHRYERWLYQQRSIFPLHSYDVAITMTRLHIYSPEPARSFLNGLSNVGSACMVNVEDGIVYSVGIVQNDGFYDKISTAAHELGHLLGAKHGDDSCVEDDTAHIMAEKADGKKTSEWSKCTRQHFWDFLKSIRTSSYPTCLFTPPQIDEVLPISLPGKQLSAHEQCRGMNYKEACVSERICGQLRCTNGKKGHKRSCKLMNTPAADGTTCGDGMICLHSLCIEETRLY